MPTITDLRTKYERERRDASLRRKQAQAECDAVLAAATAARRSNLTPAEDARVQALLTLSKRAAGDLEELDTKLVELRQAADEEDEAVRMTQISTPTNVRRPAYDEVARVGAEARTYRPDTDRTGKRFLLDVARQAIFADVEANERLARHMSEERVERGEHTARATGTGAFAGLVVPQYLTDLVAPATAALRPLANVCNRHDLPEQGMTANISRITTASSVALQASENTSVSETDMDDTILQLNVQTAAGSQTVSRQAIERGTGIEETTLEDLYRRYATTLDSTIINQASTGLSAVAQATTYTDGTPTAAELWPMLFQAQSLLEQALLGMAVPDYVAMHSRRWNWLCSQVGTSFPFVATASTPTNTGGVIVTNEYGAGVRGVLSNGLKVIVDNNIATNKGGGTEDEIFLLASSECHLWEDPNAPLLIRAEQPHAKQLGVDLVVYGYFAYTASRYANNPGKISGTGLAAPAGF